MIELTYENDDNSEIYVVRTTRSSAVAADHARPGFTCKGATWIAAPAQGHVATVLGDLMKPQFSEAALHQAVQVHGPHAQEEIARLLEQLAARVRSVKTIGGIA